MGIPRQYQRGQILLIVILIMVVTLTVGLSVISHTITTLRTTKESESSQRAFSAAEAGIEKLLNTSNTSIPTTTLNNQSSFSASSSTVSGSFIVNNLAPVTQDDGADVWLSAYQTYTSQFNGTVKVYWSTSGNDCQASAIEIILLSGTKANPTLTHKLVDACDARRASNHSVSEDAGGTLNGVTFRRSTSIAVTNGLIMRVIPLYASTQIGIEGLGGSLPAQGQNLTSTGTAAGTSRKITVFKGFPKLPMEFFSYVLFSH